MANILKKIAKQLISGINSTDKINTLNRKTEMFIEENGEKVLIKLIEIERGKHSSSGEQAYKLNDEEKKNYSVLNKGEIEYSTNHNSKKYILKRVGSKRFASH